jgi:hypothetical protein
MKAHSHKAIASKRTERGWVYCVADRACTGAAHGGIVLHDVCRCGAKRETESNGDHRVYGPWRTEDQD